MDLIGMNSPKPNPISIVRRRDELLSVADRILAAPPTKPWIRRPVPVGSRVARFVLALEHCQPTNRTGRLAGAQPWRRAKAKSDVWVAMRAQCTPWDRALPGRPQVLCCRFTRVPTDPYADWAKIAVDCLCAPRAGSTRRLGIIVDDRPAMADVVQWCEPAPREGGFVVIAVFTGEETIEE
jgi:hypothetical protein